MRFRLWGLEVFSVFVLLVWGLGMGYLLVPSYMEYAPGDPLVAVGAQQWRHGLPLYTLLPGQGCYTSVYGPATYLWTALGLALFEDPIFGSKVPSVVLCMLSSILFAWAARRSLPWPETLFALGLFSIQSLMMTEYCFGMVANSCLTLTAVLGLLSTSIGAWNGRIGLLAFATALAFCTKVHGPLYLLPAWVLLLSEGGWMRTVWCGLLALELALLPFFLPNISLRGQIDWLVLVSHHAKQWQMVEGTLLTEIVFAGPIVLLLAAQRLGGFWHLERRIFLMMLGLVMGMLLVLFPASKEGSGGHHLWPFLPWVGYLLALWLKTRGDLASPPRHLHAARIGLLVWTLSLALILPRQVSDISSFFRDSPRRALVQDDLRDLLARYPNTPVQMGCGDDRGLAATDFRPLVYQRNTPCLLDEAAAMEVVEGGQSLQPVLDAICSRPGDLWLIPKGEAPFTMTSGYEPHHRLFDPAFEDAFLARFRKISSSNYFDVYGDQGRSGREGFENATR